MTDDDIRTGEFRGDVSARLKALEEKHRTIEKRLWLGLTAVGAIAARPYVDVIQAMLGNPL